MCRSKSTFKSFDYEKMRPLSERIVSSGIGKKLYASDKSNGLLADTCNGAVITGVKGRQTGDTGNNNNNNPRKGTFSIQNGYGQPLSKHTGIVNSRQRHSYTNTTTMGENGIGSPVFKNNKSMNGSLNGKDTHHQHNGQFERQLNGSSYVSNFDTYLDSDVYSNGSNSLDASSSSNGFSTGVEEDIRERFHINETPSPTDSLCNSFHSLEEEDEHPFFAGMRDIRNPDTLKEMKIISSKGTIRGVKNRVKAGIATFLKQGDGLPKVS